MRRVRLARAMCLAGSLLSTCLEIEGSLFHEGSLSSKHKGMGSI